MSILMIGTQRSGSNLMRLMLNQIPAIEAPHPPHILQRLMPLLPFYKDLSDTSTFKQLVDDVCRLVELNPVPWEGVVLDRDDIAARCTQNSLVAVFSAVYDVLAETRGAKTWCCKSLANVHYVREVDEYLP
ncbi:MAG: sulfotransferase, partial [Symploca sp. SIO2G7]|nr:sulfotransferase [Symploca sp. SIO2G7]